MSLPLGQEGSAGLEIAVFVRDEPVCPLCHEALTEIAEVVRKCHVRTVTRVHPIDSSQFLRLSFQDDIPVVFVEGVYRFRGHVDPVLLLRLLLAGAKKDSP
jgi:hypothetical protein